MAQSSPDTRFEEVWQLVRRLSPRDKVRLIERVAPEIERALAGGRAGLGVSLLGLLTDLGPAPTADELQAAHDEAWSHLPRSDV